MEIIHGNVHNTTQSIHNHEIRYYTYICMLMIMHYEVYDM